MQSLPSAPATTYTPVAIALHWLLALMIVGSLSLGLYMADLPMPAWQQRTARGAHGAQYLLFFAVPLAGWAYS